MAAIGTIRKYSGIAVGFIGVSIIAFIVSDAFNSNNMFSKDNKTVVGVIDGEKIDYQDFQTRFDLELEKYIKRTQTENVDEALKTQLRDELWTKLQEEIIFSKEYKATGITFGSEELAYNVSGPDPHQAVKQFFTNPTTKEFDRNQLVGFLKNMDQYPEYKQIWLEFEDELTKEKLKNKYNTLIKVGMYVTKLEAKDAYYSKNQFASFEYLSLPYKDIVDSTITVSDRELKQYYKKHKDENKIDATRSMDFVAFEVIPTKEDSFELFKQLTAIKKEFSETKNDSLYVEVNSEQHFDTMYFNPGHYNATIDNLYFEQGLDDSIIGPYLEAGYYKMAKLVDKKDDSVFYYKASHILIKPKGASDKDTMDALQKARELMAEIQKGGEFDMIAMRNSEDQTSAIKGGDLGWFKDKSMVKPFMDAVKRMKKGDMVVVKSQFGAHLIKCTGDRSNTLIKVGIISKKIEPSAATFQVAYSKAVKLKKRVKNAKDFELACKELELNKMVATELRQTDKEVPGFPNGGYLISWIFRNKMGTVSDILDVNGRFVVAVITEVYEKGPAPFEKIKEDIRVKAIKEKKQEILQKKLVEALKKSKTLEEVGNALKVKVDKVTNASFDMPFITGLGEEKLLMGYVFGSTKDKLSEPIIGENAVFLFKLIDFSKVEEPKDLSDIKKERAGNLQGMSQYMTLESLKESANIKDYRINFF